MQLVKATCDNCHAQLDIDLDNLKMFCPYCGQKLLMDIDGMDKVLGAKEETKRTVITEGEQTKRVSISEEEQTRRLQMEYDFKTQQVKRDDNKLKIGLLVLLGILVLCLGIVGFSSLYNRQQHNKKNEVQLTFSSKELKGENYEDVVRRLETLGFNDIELLEDDDIVLGVFSDDGDVEKVTIAGNSSFEIGQWFSTDSKVVITYHTRKDKTK